MKWMLDTDTCIAIIRRQPPAALKKLRGKSIGQVGLSSMTLGELAFVENGYYQYRYGQVRRLGHFHLRMRQVRSTRQYNSLRTRTPPSRRSSAVNATHHAMAAVAAIHRASTADGAGSMLSLLQNG